MAADLSNPIVNSPYDPPEAYFEIGPSGPTGNLLPGRRPSESFIPIPVSKKGSRAVQQTLDFDITGERREQNTLINDIRREVEPGGPATGTASRPILASSWPTGPRSPRTATSLFCSASARPPRRRYSSLRWLAVMAVSTTGAA